MDSFSLREKDVRSERRARRIKEKAPAPFFRIFFVLFF